MANWYKRQVSSNFLSFLSKKKTPRHLLLLKMRRLINKKLHFGENISSEVCFKANPKIILTRMGELPEKTLLCPLSSVILMLFLSFHFVI